MTFRHTDDLLADFMRDALLHYQTTMFKTVDSNGKIFLTVNARAEVTQEQVDAMRGVAMRESAYTRHVPTKA